MKTVGCGESSGKKRSGSIFFSRRFVGNPDVVSQMLLSTTCVGWTQTNITDLYQLICIRRHVTLDLLQAAGHEALLQKTCTSPSSDCIRKSLPTTICHICQVFNNSCSALKRCSVFTFTSI